MVKPSAATKQAGSLPSTLDGIDPLEKSLQMAIFPAFSDEVGIRLRQTIRVHEIRMQPPLGFVQGSRSELE